LHTLITLTHNKPHSHSPPTLLTRVRSQDGATMSGELLHAAQDAGRRRNPQRTEDTANTSMHRRQHRQRGGHLLLCHPGFAQSYFRIFRFASAKNSTCIYPGAKNQGSRGHGENVLRLRLRFA